MDATDRTILAELAADAAITTSRLARKLGMARSTVQARIDRLEANGTILGYTIRLGDGPRSRLIRATALIRVEPRATAAVLQRLRAITEIEAVHTTSGRFDLIAEIAAETTAALDDVLDRIGAVTGVGGTESLIHLTTKFDRRI